MNLSLFQLWYNLFEFFFGQGVLAVSLLQILAVIFTLGTLFFLIFLPVIKLFRGRK